MRQNEKGQALVIAIILLVIAFILVFGILHFQETGTKAVATHKRVTKTRHLAEAGLDYTLHRLNSDPSFADEVSNLLTGQQRNPFDSSPGPGTIQLEEGEVTVVIEPYQ